MGQSRFAQIWGQKALGQKHTHVLEKEKEVKFARGGEKAKDEMTRTDGSNYGVSCWPPLEFRLLF